MSRHSYDRKVMESLFTNTKLDKYTINVKITRFIREVRNLPALWDQNDPGYENVLKRTAAWQVLCRKYYKDFDSKTPFEKKDILLHMQRRWKSLRNCYTRELSVRKKECTATTKSRKSKRKPYLYFDHLTFLSDKKKVIKEDVKKQSLKNTSATENTDYPEILEFVQVKTEQLENDEDLEQEFNPQLYEYYSESPAGHDQENYESAEIVGNSELTVEKVQNFPLRHTLCHRGDVDEASNPDVSPAVTTNDGNTRVPPEHTSISAPFCDTNMFEVEVDTVNNTNARTEHWNKRSCHCEADEDQLFLLSLVSHLKHIPDKFKLEAKINIMNVIKDYQNKTELS